MVLPGDARNAEEEVNKTDHAVSANSHTVIGVFADSDDAEEGLVTLRDAGFSKDNLSLVFSHSDAADEVRSQAASERGGDSTVGGVVVGGVTGGVISGLIGAGLLAIPGAGPFLAAGWLVSAAGGAGVGAAAGGWLGAITRIGVPEDVAARYEEEMAAGSWVVMALADQGDDENEAQSLLRDAGARRVDSYPYQVRPDQFPGSETPYKTEPSR